MKSKIGILCIVLGAVLLVGALGLVLFNLQQDTAARNAAMDILSRLVEQIRGNTPDEPADVIPDLELQVPPELLTDEDKKMTEVEIDGYAYIGYLSVPTLDLELPIMSSWSYELLEVAPCRYSGSVLTENMILMGHNYTSHFMPLHDVKIGALVDLVGGSDEVGHDIAMHVAATKPKALDASGVDAALLETERRVAIEKAREAGKPEAMLERIAEGTVQKYLKEVTLLSQPFVKDDKKSVSELLKQNGASVASFVLFVVGEGIEKKQSDFAAEVAEQMAAAKKA